MGEQEHILRRHSVTVAVAVAVSVTAISSTIVAA